MTDEIVVQFVMRDGKPVDMEVESKLDAVLTSCDLLARQDADRKELEIREYRCDRSVISEMFQIAERKADDHPDKN